MNTTAFYVSTRHEHHLVQYDGRHKIALGQIACLPAMPELSLVFREEPAGADAGVVLTERHTGLAFAKAATRKRLHAEVRRLLKKHGTKGVLTCLRDWARSLGVALPYAIPA
jgi:hypothetical protein